MGLMSNRLASLWRRTRALHRM